MTFSTFIKSILTAFTLILFVHGASTPASAQVSGEAFNGFQNNSKDPIQIDADELQVVDEKNQAIFLGNVTVKQGASTLKTKKLIVTYAKNSAGGQNDIDRLDMSGGLVVTSGENVVTADAGTFFVKTENIILTDNVVVAQGDNIAKGNKLTANLKSNKAVLSGGRVRSIFTPSSQKKK